MIGSPHGYLPNDQRRMIDFGLQHAKLVVKWIFADSLIAGVMPMSFAVRASGIPKTRGVRGGTL